MRLFGQDRVSNIMDRMGLKDGENIQHPMVTKSIERAQKKVEENNFGIRKRLLEYDDVMNSQRNIIYTLRKNALQGDRLQIDITNIMFDTIEEIVIPKNLVIDLSPKSSFIRKQQHALVSHYQLRGITVGKKKDKRLRIFPN